MDKEKRIRELVQQLRHASEEYYQHDREIMSNAEYDRLYDELEALEKETGIVLSSSPTVNVGYEVLSSLPKEPHPSPMLSLDKTKDAAALAKDLEVEFDPAKRAKLALDMQQVLLDDNGYVFCSFLQMSLISKKNVVGYDAHPCDYYQITAETDKK